MAHADVGSRPVPRPPKKLKKGEIYRMHLLLPQALVDLVDKFAKQLGVDEEDVLSLSGRERTRSEAVRILIFEGLKKHGLLK